MSSGYIVTDHDVVKSVHATRCYKKVLQQRTNSRKADTHGRNKYPRTGYSRPSVPLDPFVGLVPTHRREQRSSVRQIGCSV